MPDDEVATSPHETGHPRAPVHPVRRAVVVAVAALALLAWSATLEVACGLPTGLRDGVVVASPCPAQIRRGAASVLAAGVVVVGLVLLLVARRRPWARAAAAERSLFAGLVAVTVVAVLAAVFSTGFVAAI
ncbi:hypothetical protein [Oerskovia enterophila]|uniref:hypothetical protein n=1 Tax=Oerskovia enterophila TaxID=43678 RepID=UPI0033958257